MVDHFNFPNCTAIILAKVRLGRFPRHGFRGTLDGLFHCDLGPGNEFPVRFENGPSRSRRQGGVPY